MEENVSIQWTADGLQVHRRTTRIHLASSNTKVHSKYIDPNIEFPSYKAQVTHCAKRSFNLAIIFGASQLQDT